MILLSERLSKIAGFIENGERVADIGTDHGYIPIYLKQSGLSSYVVAGDINEGPLEKLEENLEKHLGDDREGINIRLGSGLAVIEKDEVDTVVIAGMGGLLMEDILSAEPQKTFSVKKFILQPRNAQDKLRKWLLESGFRITDEILARESRFVWEIICAEPVAELENLSHRLELEALKAEYFEKNHQQYEVGQFIIRKNDPLLPDFINNKIAIEKSISENAGKSSSENAACQKNLADEKIKMLEEILKNVDK